MVTSIGILTAMSDLVELIIRKYKTKDQLIQEGIWKGEIYKRGIDIPARERSWIWKTLLLYSDDTQGDNERDIFALPGGSLVPIPDTIAMEAAATITPQLKINTTSVRSPVRTSLSLSPTSPTSPLRQITHGVRNLTPREVHIHPLQDRIHSNDVGSDGDGDNVTMPLRETLEIIDLDLSRLMTDDLFQDPEIRQTLQLLMFNYLLRVNDDCKHPAAEQLYRYRQGFHEILGIVFLQFYRGKKQTTDLNLVLLVFGRLMQTLDKTFYSEESLLNWESTVFQPILQLASPKLYNCFYPTADKQSAEHDPKRINTIWLIRWTRLLFLREIPRNDMLCIWDHILTSTVPFAEFVACVIVALLLTQHDMLMGMLNSNNDPYDLLEYMLHFSDREYYIDTVKVCQAARRFCELWIGGDHRELRVSAKAFLKLSKYTVITDPNRKRVEDRLRERVASRLSGA